MGTGGRLAGRRAAPLPARPPTGSARGAAAAVPAAAAAVATRLQPDVLPLTKVDEYGAISILESEAAGTFVPQTFENVDGRRIEDGRYAAFTRDLTGGCARGRGEGEEAQGRVVSSWA